MKSITIDRSRPLREQPKTGHNRWHPDVPPAIEVDEGEEVALETRDATDGYLHPKSTVSDFAGLPQAAFTR
jgi:formamidase